MPDTDHPKSEILSAFANGGLPDNESSSVEKHINECESCCDRLQQFSLTKNEFVSEIKDALSAPRLEITENSSTYMPSKKIGPYKLLQRIGIGGMGEVWMAEQQHPVRRSVAIKLTQASVNTKEIIARFEAERQALSMMDHPNIAKVLDAGTDMTGKPYFVMELVKGIPLIKYCDQKRLNVEDRLKLFVSVCKAVQHAHQKGIIHRDLKPGNVLVALYDGEPVPKVIDFGLAKAMDNSMRLTDKTIFTEFGKIVGTLNYMSPEQAEMNALDVDTRTDVYSLGVILYELLTGTTPVEEDTIKNTAFLKVLEIIRETDPPAPSVRVNASDSAQSVSELRDIGIQNLRRTLNGELDWVVMKALDKNRDRRYSSASNFADDVGRFLKDEPVLARPASTGYQIRRFVRKNRGLVASISALTTLLVLGTVVSGYFAIQARNLATEASLSARRSDEVLKIVTDSFRSTNPEQGSNAEMRAVDVLLNAQEAMQDDDLDFRGREKLMEALGDSFAGIGDNQSAAKIRRKLADITSIELGEHHIKTLLRMSDLAGSFMQNGQIEKSIEIHEEVIPLIEEIRGTKSIDTLGAKLNLATSYSYAGRHDKAIELGENTLQQLDETFGPGNRATILLLHNLAVCYSSKADHKKALTLCEAAFDRMKKYLGRDYPDTLNAQVNCAVFARNAGVTGSGPREQLEDAVIRLQKKVGGFHQYTLQAMISLALMSAKDGFPGEAVTWAEKAFNTSLKKFGSKHPYTQKAEKMLRKIKESHAANS